MIKSKPLELYIHIPFCVRKCSYCDFLSFPCEGEVQEAYMAALFSELAGKADSYSDYEVVSVFIGGGTPSVLEGEGIEKLMRRAGECFQVAGDVGRAAESAGIGDSVKKEVAAEADWSGAEITIEVNPGTADLRKLETYRAAGINRLSIGLQSAQDQELRTLGRIHSYEQFLETYRLAREAGFHNINVDVMSGLPGQSLASWEDTLRKLLALTPPPEHISAYSLIVEEGTPFARLAAAGRLVLPDEDCERLMYEETKRILDENGLQRYEISNYAREGFACRHNCGYWKRTEYLGLGLGAASLVGNTRFHNTESLQEYLENPLDCVRELQELTVKEQMEETLFLGLRMTEGVSEGAFREKFGCPLEEVYGSVIQKCREQGLLRYRWEVSSAEKRLALTDKGLDLANYVMAQFLLD